MTTKSDRSEQSMGPFATVLETVRQPEYTGENRCIPCTVVNLVIAAGLASVGWLFAPVVGVVVAVLGFAAIWLRGYLIPGTPTLTKRYFPDRVLAWFDKVPEQEYTPEELDVEAILMEDGVLVETADGADLKVAPDFRAAWAERMRENDRERDAASLAWLLDIDPDRLTVKPSGEALVARVDGEWVGQWESRAAFVADVAAATIFEDRGGTWDELPTWARSEVLGGLRLFLERCPTCDGDVVLEQTVVQSCCRDIDVLALTCQACGARLFETPIDGTQLEEIAGGGSEQDATPTA